jgi:3-phosphoshikimate 1-carboxyvinyltransferase
VKREPNLYVVPPGQRYLSPGETAVDGDWSNAAFWLVAGALGGPVVCTGLDRASRQGDRLIAAILARMGAEIETGETSCTVRKAPLRAVDIDAAEIPDLVPILAVAASVAEGTTRIRNAARLRIKESDRLSTVAENLKAIGARIRELDDGLIIDGRRQLDGGCVSGCGDHRIVMAMAIASCVCKNEVVIKDAEAVNKSYPGFFSDFQKLGGCSDVIHTR